MRSLLAIWFSISFLIQGITPGLDLCCELQKIPNLLSHYAEHKDFDNDSFIQFLREDFFNEGHDMDGKHDTEEHEKMPFHGNHSCSHAQVFMPSYIHIEVDSFEINSSTSYSFHNEQVNSDFSYQPFQPPKG